MRALYLANGNKEFKFADTTTEIQLNALDDGIEANLTENAKVRIKNASGYLLDINASVTNGQAVITSGQLDKLPAGNYLLELWDTVNGGTAIYPSDGFLALKINENVTGLSGGLVSSITVNDFTQRINDLSQQLKKEISDAVTNRLTGDLRGEPGPQGPPGETPTIDDNGHWKIGNTVTQYLAGVKDSDDSATLLDINTDKAHYYPSEKVVFHATSVSGHGHLVVKYYNLNNLIATKDVYYGTSELSWSWFLPSTDNIGYSVVINNYV